MGFEDEVVYEVLGSLQGRRVGQRMRCDLRHWTLQIWKKYEGGFLLWWKRTTRVRGGTSLAAGG